jgi:hypothetical protein
VVEEIAQFEPERIHNVSKIATPKTEDQCTAIATFADTERIFVVIVRRAQARPATTTGPDVFKQRKDPLHGTREFSRPVHDSFLGVFWVGRAGRRPSVISRSVSVAGIRISLPILTVATRRSSTQRRMQALVTPSASANW